MRSIRPLPSQVPCLSRPPAFQKHLSPMVQFLLEKEVLYSPKTAEWYRACLKDFSIFADYILDLHGQEVQPSQITRSLVVMWLASLKSHMKDVSINNRFRGFRAYLNWLVQEQFIKSSPIEGMKAPRYTKNLPGIFQPEQIEAMLKLCPPNRWWGARDAAMIALLLRTGMRINELANMRVEDIQWKPGQVKVLGKGRKERRLWLDKVCIKTLLRYQRFRNIDSGYWWRGKRDRLTVEGAKKVFQRLGRRAGIEGVRCSAHTFRHTFAVSYLRAGGDIRHLQEILGHKSLRATEVYLQIIDAEYAMAQHQKLDPFAKWASA